MSDGDAPPRGPVTSAYLDWNATAPPLPEVIDRMAHAARTTWGNPASVHAEGRAARAVVEDAREAVAALLGVDARDVFLTSGATEANNLALSHAEALVTSRLEHPSVVRVAERLSDAGRTVRFVPVPPGGRLRVEDVEAAIFGLPKGFVVALMAANHETGVLQPVREVGELVRERGGRLHVDAVQAVGKIPLEAFAAGDSASLAGHKLRGPKGIGALVLRTPGLPRPVLVGGAQERGVRPGTVDPVAASGLAVAVRRATHGGPSRYAALEPLRDRIEARLAGLAEVNGAGEPRLPHVTSLSFEGCPGDELVAAFDLAGVRVSSGSACSAGTQEASPVITAMLGRQRALQTVRASLGDATTAAEVDFAIETMIRRVTRRSSSPARST
ncbi:MAG TPA: cysteine desulfurase family protein [Polyangiaceae bacterium]|nr:cysteine desulfurase family protein [Polyangiaceae bacterium]